MPITVSDREDHFVMGRRSAAEIGWRPDPELAIWCNDENTFGGCNFGSEQIRVDYPAG